MTVLDGVLDPIRILIVPEAVTSEGGGLFPREVEKRIGVVQQFSAETRVGGAKCESRFTRESRPT